MYYHNEFVWLLITLAAFVYINNWFSFFVSALGKYTYYYVYRHITDVSIPLLYMFVLFLSL